MRLIPWLFFVPVFLACFYNDNVSGIMIQKIYPTSWEKIHPDWNQALIKSVAQNIKKFDSALDVEQWCPG